MPDTIQNGTEELKAFMSQVYDDSEFEVSPLAEEGIVAGDLAAGAVKVPVKTFIGNMLATAISIPKLGVASLTSGSATNSWYTGTAKTSLAGDLSIGGSSPNAQRRKGTSLTTALNDDDRNMAVLGRDWREFQLLNSAVEPSGTLNLVPARDTHRIFIFRTDSAAAFNIRLASTGLKAGMKFMFVNLSAASANGTNEQQTITVSATGGTFTVSYAGQTTAALAYNISAANLQTALEGLSTIGTGNITVSGGPTYTLTFINDLGNTNVAAVTTNATLLTGGAGTAAVATTVPGVAAQGQLVIVANGAGIAGNAINRLTMSPGAAMTLIATHPDLAISSTYRYMIQHKIGTIA